MMHFRVDQEDCRRVIQRGYLKVKDEGYALQGYQVRVGVGVIGRSIMVGRDQGLDTNLE